MFEAFFVILKNHEVPVTPGEWLSLQEALDKGLCGSSLSSFYSLSRMLLVKRETDYDKFDSAFEEYFNGIRGNTPLTARLLEWLDKPDMNELLPQWKEEKKMLPGENPESKEGDSSKEEIEERMRKRLEEQTSEQRRGLLDRDHGEILLRKYRRSYRRYPCGRQKRPPVCLRRHGRTQVQRFPG